MQFITCTYDRHAAAILDIFNEAIASSTAIYEYRPRTMDTMAAWFKDKEAGGWPVIGAVQGDTLLGFGTYGTFRTRPAYKYTVEHSVYIRKDRRGQGVGRALLREVIATARANDVHVLVGGIDAANAASIRLHEQEGFMHAGTIRQAGFKFGRWLDLAFYQLTLDTPTRPVDG